MKNNFLQYIVLVFIFLILPACMSVQGHRNQISTKEYIQIIDVTLKTSEVARYVEFDLNQDLIALKKHIETLLQQSKVEKKLDAHKFKP